MSTLPAQVQKQIKDAEQLFAGQHTPPKEELTPNDPPIDGELPIVAVDEIPTEHPPKVEDPPELAPADSKLTELTAQVTALTTQLGTWEQRYRTLQGMIAKKDEQIEQMQGLVDALQKPAAPVEPVDVVTEAERKEYGDELIELIGRKAKEVAQTEVGTVRQELDSVQQDVGNVAQTAAEAAQARYFAELTTAAPTWRELNTDTGYLAWLNEFEPLAGATRQALLQESFQMQDVARTAQFFNAYAQTQAPAPAPSVAEPVVTTPQEIREQMVAPGSSKGAPVTTGQSRMWTRAEIKQFYSDAQNGRVSDKDRAQIEADIFHAQANDRIIG